MSAVFCLLLALSSTIFLPSQLLFFLYEMLIVTFLQQVLIAIICMGLILNCFTNIGYEIWFWLQYCFVQLGMVSWKGTEKRTFPGVVAT